MQLFWGTWTEDGRAILTEEESNHAARVLRKVPGDELWVGNGAGAVALVRLVHVSQKIVWGTVLEINPHFGAVPGNLHLVICPTKNLDRTEWAVEKAVELGVSHVHLTLSQRSERKHVTTERLQKIADSAAKQSLKGMRPEVHALLPWGKLVADPRWDDWNKGVFHCAEGAKISALNWTLQTPYRAVVAIGPEGDFTLDEIALAERSGWTPLSLGASRLRTETAAVAAAALLLQRWVTPLVVDGNAL